MSEQQKATDQYLELYKLAVEMADRVAARRASLTTLPLTANTALFAILQRRSKRLNHRTVAAVLEEAAGVFGTESRDRSAHRFEKSFSATRLGFTHQAFDLAECLLDGVEVR